MAQLKVRKRWLEEIQGSVHSDTAGYCRFTVLLIYDMNISVQSVSILYNILQTSGKKQILLENNYRLMEIYFLCTAKKQEASGFFILF